MRSKEIQRSILQTLAYADVFEYPLTIDEIWKFLIIKKSIEKKVLALEIVKISIIAFVDNCWYCFSDRMNIVQKRKERELASKKKFHLAKYIASILTFIPTIQYVGISGALAMSNADKDDDIDLFVVTKKNTLFTTRLLILLMLEILGKRRKRKSTSVSDTICVNMIIDETALSFGLRRQNLYTAHEIAQMIPLVNKYSTYEKFISANKWVKKFLPNSLNGRSAFPIQIPAESFFSKSICSILCIKFVEYVSKIFQMWYIKRHVTKETISDHLLAFHPHDYKEKISWEYKKKLKIYAEI